MAHMISNYQAGPEAFDGLLGQLREAHEKQCECLAAEVARLQAQLSDSAGAPTTSTVKVSFSLPETFDSSVSLKEVDETNRTAQMDKSQSNPESSQLSLPSSLGKPSVWSGSDASMTQGRSTVSTQGSQRSTRRNSHVLEDSALVRKITGKAKLQDKDKQFSEANFFSRFRRKVGSLVQRPAFESFFACVIMFNAMVMGAEMQYSGIQIGYEIKFPGARNTAKDAWPLAEDTFVALDWVMGLLFTLEVLLKFTGLGVRAFLTDIWNYLDVLIVICWLIEKLGSDFPVDTQVLRLMRLVRLLRLLRLVRSLEGFDSLYLMTKAVKGSLSILSWAVVLLFVIQVAICLLVNQLICETYLRDESVSVENRREVFELFGSFTRGMLSMFEITLANWAPICRVLSERVTEWFMLFCVMHKLTIGFAVIGVINGVFMQETFKAAHADDVIMMRQKNKATQLHLEKMQSLFQEADTNGDGTLDIHEFRAVANDRFIKTWLGSMELEADDADGLYELLTADDGCTEGLSAQDLIRGVARLKGTARSIDLAKSMRQTSKTLMKLDMFIDEQHQLHTSRAPTQPAEADLLRQTSAFSSPEVMTQKTASTTNFMAKHTGIRVSTADHTRAPADHPVDRHLLEKMIL